MLVNLLCMSLRSHANCVNTHLLTKKCVRCNSISIVLVAWDVGAELPILNKLYVHLSTSFARNQL